MEAEYFVGPPPPDKDAQLKRSIEKAQQEVFERTDRSKPAGCLIHGIDLKPLECGSCKAFADAVLDEPSAVDQLGEVSADQPEITVDFSTPPVPKGKPSGMAPPEGLEAVLGSMRRMGEQDAKPPSKIILPGQEFPEDQEIEVANEILDADDPTFLLEQQLGILPGISKTRASRMAKGSRAGMHNLTVDSMRKYSLEERAAKQAQRAGKKKKKGRRR